VLVWPLVSVSRWLLELVWQSVSQLAQVLQQQLPLELAHEQLLQVFLCHRLQL
jgi:hypothetical protein